MDSTDRHARSTVAFVGGGSIGHLAPSIAVYEALKHRQPEMRAIFLCSARADERQMLAEYALPSAVIHAGKFPRGLSARWITFPFLFAWSFVQALSILKREQVQVIFSKGGYVSAPVCLAGWILRIPIVLHESDSVTGMGNRLISRMARRICTGFPMKTADSRIVHTGNPVRSDIAHGSAAAGQRITGFSGKRPVVLIIGGSQGAQSINDAVEAQLDALLEIADVMHLTGRGKMTKRQHARYVAREFVVEELAHLYALATVVVSRAGASVLSELAVLSKPVLVIPLEGVAHDHQVHNAQALEAAGAVVHLPQQHICSLAVTVKDVLDDTQRCHTLGQALHRFFPADAADRVATIIANGSLP